MRHEFKNAEEIIRQAVNIAGDRLHILGNLGNALTATSRAAEAIGYLEKALEKFPFRADFATNLSLCYLYAGRIEDSLAMCEKAIELEPNSPRPITTKANLLISLGKLDEAAELCFKSLEMDEREAWAYYALAHMHGKRFDLDEKDIKRRLQLPNMTPKDLASLHYALYKIEARNKNYETSFFHLAECNRQRRKLEPSRIENSNYLFNLMRNTFTPEFVKEHQIDNDDDQPIFVLGMPRSGTTLVEQIISSHPDVTGGGELYSISRAATAEMSKTINLDIIQSVKKNPNFFKNFANNYKEDTKHLRKTKYFTDKMPDNFRHIGLIVTAMPKAKIVLCTRDPIANCYSCFKEIFKSGHSYSYDLKELGHYYNNYQNLVDFWLKHFGDKIHIVKYEDMVTKQEQTTRELIEFLGIGWHDDCLNHQRNEKAVMTASSSQVRDKIYTSSLNSWEVYKEGLRPLIETLNS